MTPIQKRAFVDELITNVHNEIVHKLAFMPDDWDGIELRAYLAQKFSSCVISGTMTNARKRRFNNEILVRNL